MNTGQKAGTRRWWALGAIAAAVLAVGLDTTILSVALPTLSKALHASESDLQWFSSGYALALAAAMLPMGLLGDRYGHKKLLLIALPVFGGGSALCAYSSSVTTFMIARILMGIAGAALVVMALSAVTILFEKTERPKAVGIWSAVNFLALPLGPILGGWLLTHYWWGSVFLINVPVALLALIAVATLIPESERLPRAPFDIFGIITSTGGLSVLTYGLIKAGEEGWSNAGALMLMMIGLVSLASFFVWERRLTRHNQNKALVDMSLFSSASFTWGIVLSTLGIFAMIGVLFTLPQYFQGVLDVNAIGSGMRLLPVIGGLVLGAVPADRFAKLWGAKITVAIGFIILAIGTFMGAATKIDSSTSFVVAWTMIVGVGIGLSLATASSAALVELSEKRSGVGSALLQAANKVGSPFGAAILGSVLSGGYLAHLQLSNTPLALHVAVRESVFGGVAVAKALNSPTLLSNVQQAFMQGMQRTLLFSGGVALFGVVVSFVFLPRANVAPSPGSEKWGSAKSLVAPK